MLDMWAECLKELGNAREYIAVALAAIASSSTQLHSSLASMWSLVDLIEASNVVDERIAVPFEKYFTNMSVCPYISQLAGIDGFELEVRLRSAVSESFRASSISVRITAVNGESPDSIWLSCDTGTMVDPGLNRFIVASKVSSHYNRTRILLLTSNRR